ncbi:MAG TPA: FHA domain-containing protein [Promineifilum sp.]|nr:FHA domain-containing protein [Promineifilum sp.]HNS39668.1 FHA domain-containing protein [Promineifilum sp.]
MEMITCPVCEAQTPADAAVCGNCGHPFRSGSDDFSSEPVELLALTTEPVDEVADEGFMPRLVIQPDGFELALVPGQRAYVIGREDPGSGSHPDVDLVPFGGEEGGVSRRHAQITWDGAAYFIEDLDSVNYTFVNKRKIAVGIKHPLQNGDEIRLGRVLMRFELG